MANFKIVFSDAMNFSDLLQYQWQEEDSMGNYQPITMLPPELAIGDSIALSYMTSSTTGVPMLIHKISTKWYPFGSSVGKRLLPTQMTNGYCYKTQSVVSQPANSDGGVYGFSVIIGARHVDPEMIVEESGGGQGEN